MTDATDEYTFEAEDPSGQTQEIIIRANYELFILALLILQVFNSVMLLLLQGGEGKVIPAIISGIIAIFLMGDALYRVWKWRDRRTVFFRYDGYLLILGSLPIPFAAILRLIWLQRISVKLRRRDIANIPNVVIRKRAQSAMLGVVLAAILVLEFSSILIIRTEAGAAGGNIQTAGDALWWALVTMATVGYGDKYPVTPYGRVIAVVAMSVGVGIFTVLTSFMAEVFTRPRQTRDKLKVIQETAPHTPQASLNAIKSLIDQHEKTSQANLQEIHEKLDELQRRLVIASKRAEEETGALPEDTPDSS